MLENGGWFWLICGGLIGSVIAYFVSSPKPKASAAIIDGEIWTSRRWEMRNPKQRTWALVEFEPTNRMYPYRWEAGWADRVSQKSGRCTTFESAQIIIRKALNGESVE